MERNNFHDIFFQYIQPKGNKIKPAKKNRIKARVNGGIFCKANLNIGAAAPQIRLVIIRARTGFIVFFYPNTLLILQLSQSSLFEYQ